MSLPATLKVGVKGQRSAVVCYSFLCPGVCSEFNRELSNEL